MLPRRLWCRYLQVFVLIGAVAFGRAERATSVSRQGGRTLVLDGMGKGTADLDGLWQFHLGDDPQWAQPGFDDSGWESILADAPWGAQGHPSYAGIAWYRRHVNIVPAPGATGQYRVLIPDCEDAYEDIKQKVVLSNWGIVATIMVLHCVLAPIFPPGHSA